MAALDIGYKTDVSALLASEKPNILYMLGADEALINRDQLKDTFIIYQGHHGDRGAEIADVVLPGAAYTEKEATYVNTEGRAQRTQLVVKPPGKAKEDWQIIKAVSEIIGKPLPYENVKQMRKRMMDISPTLITVGKKHDANFFNVNVKLSQVRVSSLLRNMYNHHHHHLFIYLRFAILVCIPV